MFTVPPAVELLNYWTTRKAVHLLSQILIFLIAGRISEAAMGGTGGAQRSAPLFPVT
jgi:hypothetical protein